MREVNPVLLGKRLRDRLADFGWSGNFFAKKAEIDQSLIQRLCAGQTSNTKYIKKIAKELHTSDDYLLFGDPPKDVFPPEFAKEVYRDVLGASLPELLLVRELIHKRRTEQVGDRRKIK